MCQRRFFQEKVLEREETEEICPTDARTEHPGGRAFLLRVLFFFYMKFPTGHAAERGTPVFARYSDSAF